MNAPRNHPVPNMACPSCGTTFNLATTVAGRPGLHRGNIIICTNCANVLKVGDSSLYRMSRDEFEKLPNSQKAVIAVATVKVKEMLDDSKKIVV